ncbi:hypothetical protein EST38_g13201 [Candolleomyces aberdarensis]|uniref:DUF6532 domain-containing protein n=1 Tax=Candolleomyces aberdarensis TaxID=2316362 RepID=A0A4Q2D0I2_9AGAR|nr:hypothetical protein EST38_g13201 [Candolleomyces aberdarensis]
MTKSQKNGRAVPPAKRVGRPPETIKVSIQKHSGPSVADQHPPRSSINKAHETLTQNGGHRGLGTHKKSHHRASDAQPDNEFEGDDKRDELEDEDLLEDDAADYEGVNLLDQNERPSWPAGDASATGNSRAKLAYVEGSGDDIDVDRQQAARKQKSKQTKQQHQKQAAETLLWVESDQQDSDQDLDVDQNPIADKVNPCIWFAQNVLFEQTHQKPQCELVQHFRSDAKYGTSLGTLVKPRFSKYRITIWEAAQTAARIFYGLDATHPEQMQKKITDLLRHDTFVYNIDSTTIRPLYFAELILKQSYLHQGRVLSNEPYRHPAVIKLIQWFFEDRKSLGQQNPKKFTSSFSEEADPERSREKEIPIPMLAFATTMLRVELKLWDRGTRLSIKFDADAYSTVYNHHVDVLNQLREKSLTKFHWLVAYLYDMGIKVTKSTIQGGEGANSKLGILDLDGMANYGFLLL